MSMQTANSARRQRPSVTELTNTRIELKLPESASGGLEFPLLLVCFFLSGLAALLYQTAWMRQFAVVFGTSELAIATVLSAYMAGLAAGSWVAGRFVNRVRRLVLTYGVLEFTIAAGALLVSWGLAGARWVLILVAGGQPAPPDAGGWVQPTVYVATTFAILFIPTACMGATLPLLTKHAVHRSDQIGRRVGLLYAMNTLGAVVGTIVAGFLLLPSLGLWGTTLCGVGVNVMVFGVAVWLTRVVGRTATPLQSDNSPLTTQHSSLTSLTTDDSRLPWHRGTGLLMPMMLVSGFVSFTYEVLWSRLLGHVVLGSTHAFATMLATFLTGITIGSAIAAPLAKSKRAGLIGFLLAQLGTASLSIGLFWFLEAGIGWLSGDVDKTLLNPVWNAIRCSAVLLPSTLCIGMTFPFAVRAISDDPALAGSITARVYAWNTIGGVLGAIVAGFLLIPALSFTGTVQVAVGINLLLAAGAALLLPMLPALRFGIVAVTMMVAIAYQPSMPDRLLRTSAMSGEYSDQLVYLGVGRSSTVRVGESTMCYILTNNGLPEAMITPQGAPTVGLHLHQWLTALPLVARPEAESILVIGFGSGGAVEQVPASVKEVDVIELEPLVIEANRHCSSMRRFDPLADPRINIILNDARGALSLTDKKYDIIVSQPSHPWTAGASHLYTREFMELVREHLNDDGVFLQWMNTAFVDDDLFRTLGRTVLDVFPNVRLYQPQENVLFFLASSGDLDLERQLARTGEPLRSASREYGLMGLNGISTLATALRLDAEGLRQVCGAAVANTDDRNRLAFAASHNRAELGQADLAKLLRDSDALLNTQSALYRPADLRLNPAIIAARIHAGEFQQRGRDYADVQPTEALRSLVWGIVHRDAGDKVAAKAAFDKAWTLDRSLADAGYQYCELAVRSMADGTQTPRVDDVFEQLPEPERTVMTAAVALHRSDFGTIQSLDDRLSRVSPERTCYEMAVRCRCAWRAASTTSPDRVRLAGESIVLADEALAIRSSTQALLMRFNAVAMLGYSHGVAETALHLGVRIAADPESGAAFLREVGAQVIIPKLERLKYDSRVDQSRLRTTRELYDRAHSASIALPRDVSHPALPY